MSRPRTGILIALAAVLGVALVLGMAAWLLPDDRDRHDFEGDGSGRGFGAEEPMFDEATIWALTAVFGICIGLAVASKLLIPRLRSRRAEDYRS